MYDADRYDAEILLDRSLAPTPYTEPVIIELLGIKRTKFSDLRRKGIVPAPANPGGKAAPNEWSRDQVLDILTTNIRTTPTLKPIEHGTYKGYCAHLRRKIPICDLCAQANRDRTNQYHSLHPRGKGKYKPRPERRKVAA